MDQPRAPRSSMTKELLENVNKPVYRPEKNEKPKRMLKSPYSGSLRGPGSLFAELDKTSSASKDSYEASQRIRSFLDQRRRNEGGKKRRRTKKKRKRRRTKKKRKSRRRRKRSCRGRRKQRRRRK